MSKELEKRAYTVELRAEQKEDNSNVVVVTGRPIVYDSKTDLGEFYEIIAPGALDGANLKDVRFLVNHDVSMIPLARSRNNNENSTMQLKPVKEGLDMRVNLDAENSVSKNLISAIDRGDVSGMSFMFSIGNEEWADLDTDKPTRTITQIKDVIEVSAVTFPAYEDTEIHLRNKAALDNARAALDSAKAKQQASLDNELALAKEKMKLIGVI